MKSANPPLNVQPRENSIKRNIKYSRLINNKTGWVGTDGVASLRVLLELASLFTTSLTH